MTARVRFTLATLVSPGEADTLKPGKVGPEHGDGRAYGSTSPFWFGSRTCPQAIGSRHGLLVYRGLHGGVRGGMAESFGWSIWVLGGSHTGSRYFSCVHLRFEFPGFIKPLRVAILAQAGTHSPQLSLSGFYPLLAFLCHAAFGYLGFSRG